jgi:alanyl-tRNA synthetase
LAGPVEAAVDSEKRLYIMYNHTATHLLHAALRKVLGKHVAQKGSLVSSEYLRLIFRHFAKLSDQEIREIEFLVNEKIRENIPVITRVMNKDEAMELGAMALFGEKYGEKVRVVMIDPNYSIELCGGTHVMHTGMIGMFYIQAETAVAAGVRRIEALTGPKALAHLTSQLEKVKEMGSLLKAADPVKAVEKLIQEKAELEKKLEHLENRMLVGIRNELLHKDEIINGVSFVGDIVNVSNPDALKKICFDLKNNLHDYMAVIGANIGGKPYLAIGISDTVVAARKLDAGKIIKETVAPLIKGGGGGQKNLATAGGQDSSRLLEAIDSVRKILEATAI